MNVSPVSGALGAIVRDISLVEADHGLLNQVKSLLNDYLVLYFPD